ncbi:MAG: hypothetical protein P0S96_01245 [Simkaniaceae bacterium]|nr:hypothetical protein [Candidatus Sacchlamyda saccharinae]
MTVDFKSGSLSELTSRTGSPGVGQVESKGNTVLVSPEAYLEAFGEIAKAFELLSLLRDSASDRPCIVGTDFFNTKFDQISEIISTNYEKACPEYEEPLELVELMNQVDEVNKSFQTVFQYGVEQ